MGCRLFPYMLAWACVAPVSGQIRWKLVNPLKGNAMLRSAARGNGVYVMAGDKGAIFRSSDALVWGDASQGRLDAPALAFGAGHFVMVGSGGPGPGDGTGISVISTDGIHWTNGATLDSVVPGGVGFHDVVHTGSRFVAVGEHGCAYTSTNGLDWKLRASIENSPLYSIAFGAEGLVAVGGSPPYASIILSSKDGTDWTRRQPAIYRPLRAVAYGGGQFVAVGDDGLVVTSPDGVQWTFRDIASTPFLTNVAYGSGRFLALGRRGSGLKESSVCLASTDGTTWTEQSLSPARKLGGIAFLGDRFVILADSLTAWTSPDGLQWTFTPTPEWIDDMAFGGGRFVAIGSGGFLLHQPENGIWRRPSAGSASSDGMGRIAYGLNRFVAVGMDGAVRVSPDGDTWSDAKSGATETLLSVTGGKDGFVAVGRRGTVIRSTDAVSWKKRVVDTGMLLEQVQYGAGRFVAVGYQPPREGSVLLHSVDGDSWTVDTVFDITLNSRMGGRILSFGNGKFVAGGRGVHGAYFAVSGDGMKWTLDSLGSMNEVISLGFGSGTFVAQGLGNVFYMLTSPDGLEWTQQAIVDHSVNTFAFGAGEFLAAGESGIIYASPLEGPTSLRMPGLGARRETPRARIGRNGILRGGRRINGKWIDLELHGQEP